MLPISMYCLRFFSWNLISFDLPCTPSSGVYPAGDFNTIDQLILIIHCIKNYNNNKRMLHSHYHQGRVTSKL